MKAPTPEQITIQANGVGFAALSYGSGPLAICLHGFPDTPATFEHQLPLLLEAGYRVVTPFMRGYAPTQIPAGGCYEGAMLGRDVIALIDALGGAPALVVGHDWGAVAASHAALAASEKIRKLVTMAVPCGPGVAITAMTNFEQQKRFWYQYLFTLPIAETLVAMNDMAFIRALWQSWSPSWKFGEAEIAPVLECLGTPGVLAAALAYYKPIYDPAVQNPALAAATSAWGITPIQVETLHVHGAEDGCLGTETCEGMESVYPQGLDLRIVEGAGHFVHRERPDEVNAVLRDFI